MKIPAQEKALNLDIDDLGFWEDDDVIQLATEINKYQQCAAEELARRYKHVIEQQRILQNHTSELRYQLKKTQEELAKARENREALARPDKTVRNLLDRSQGLIQLAVERMSQGDGNVQ